MYHRSRSRSRSPSYGLEEYTTPDTRDRTGMRGTALPGRFFTAGRGKRGRGSRYLYVNSAQRYYDDFADDIREIKQQRYSDHDTEESSANTWEHSYITPDRLNKRQNNDFSREDDPELNGYRYSKSLGHCNLLKGTCLRSSTRRYVHPDDACYDGRSMERDEYKERTYDRGDLDVSFRRSESRGVNNIPCKFFAEGYCKYGEDCSFSHQEPLGHSGDHKRDDSVKIGSCLSWKGPKRDDQRTTNEAPRSSRWRYDRGKESYYNTGSDNSLSQNSPPRRDGRRTTEDASKSFQRRSDDDNHDFNVDTRNNLSRNSPKWDEERKKEMETPYSLSPKGPNWGKQRKIIDSLNSDRQRLDDGRLDSNGKSGRRFSRNGLKGDEAAAKEATNSGKCGNNVKIATTSSWNGPKWGDQIASREPPNYSIWRSDDDKQDSDIKVDHVDHGQSWNGPRWGDLTLTKAPNSSQSRSDADICSNGVRTNHISSCNDPKWGDQSNKEASENGPEGKERRKNDLETPNSLPGNGSKWGTQRKVEGSLNSSPRRLGDDSRGYNAKSSRRFSRNDSKGSTQTTTKDAANKWGNTVRINNNSSWNGPKWGDQTTKGTSWNGPKWGDQTPTETSWNGPKLGDQTTKETSWHGPKWGDETSEVTPWNGPKWGDLRTTKDADADKSFQESSDRRTKETSWNGPKWVNQTTKDTSRHSPAWGDKTTVEKPLSGSNWGDIRTTKDADAHKSSQESPDRRTKETSWNGSNWGDQTTKESSRRSPTWGDKTTEETPKNGSKLGDLRTTKDADAHKSSQESSYRRTKVTSWTGPKWVDQTTKETSWHGPPWGYKTTSETPQNGSRWGDLRTAKDADAHKSSQESSAQRSKEKSWNGPKWGDQTTMETSLHGPTLGDRTTEEAPQNGLKWGDLRTEWLKGGPKWGEQVSSHCSPVSSIQRIEDDSQNHIMKHDNILPVDVSRGGDQTSAKDPPYSSHRRSASDKWGNVETDHDLSSSSQKRSGDTIRKDASLTSQLRSDNDECRPCEETNNSLAQNSPKWSHQMASRDVSNSSMWRSDDAGSGASACGSIVIEVTRHEPSPLASNVHEQKSPQGAFQEPLFFRDQKSTQEDSGNDPNAMIISQPPSNIQDSNFCLCTQEVQDQQSIKLSEKGQTLFPPPHEDLSQAMVQSVALNGQDTISQRTPSQQNLNSDLQNHQVLEKSNQLQHLSVTLKPLTVAATPTRANLEYLSTELITSDSIDLNRLPISFETKEAAMDESLTAKKNLVLAPAVLSGQPDNSTWKENTDMEEKNFQGNQEQKQDVHARLMAGGDSERLNDEQGIRMLKFALVEFVKDILKPSWRDGHLSKEAHKIIVKKVVDKVTCTVQGPAIPRSQEHIDQYMSYSKTKLTNLVMGYLGMYLKK